MVHMLSTGIVPVIIVSKELNISLILSRIPLGGYMKSFRANCPIHRFLEGVKRVGVVYFLTTRA